MKIDKAQMMMIFSKQLEIRGNSMTDKEIEDSIDEAQAMYDDAAPFMRKDMHPIQHMVPAFMAGIQFALDKFQRGTMDMKLSTKDGGKNYDVDKLTPEEDAKVTELIKSIGGD